MDSTEQYIRERFEHPKNQSLVVSSLGGSKFIVDCFIEKMGGVDGKTILDAGCGKGRFTEALAEAGADYVVGVDPVPMFIEEANNLKNQHFPTEYMCSLTSEMPLEDGRFDAIICSEVIEHIPHPEKVFEEFKRVLKPGGMLLVFDKQLNALHPRYFIPVRIWKWWLEKRNKWMYEANGPFRERWYTPKELRSILDQFFETQPATYLSSHTRSEMIFKYLPKWTWYYACWTAVKK